MEERGIELHVTVIDKSERKDGTLPRSAFSYDLEKDVQTCPEGKTLRSRWRQADNKPAKVDADGQMKCRALRSLSLEIQMLFQRRGANRRSINHEGARDLAREIADTDACQTSRRDRKKVEMLLAHLKHILKPGRLRLRGPCGASDEFLLAATVQNLRTLAKLRPKLEPGVMASNKTDFFIKI